MIQIFRKEMDALLQIIVPKLVEVEGLELSQPVYEWDGIKYPQGSKIVSWQDISLSFDEKSKYLDKFLPPIYMSEEWIWLKVSDETLDKYEITVNDESEKDTEKQLEIFLRFLLADINRWVVVFLLQYDQIDNIYELNVEGFITKLRNNLNRNATKEGFIAYAGD